MNWQIADAFLSYVLSILRARSRAKGLLVFNKFYRLCRIRPTACSKGICLVTFGAKVTKTWGWEYERVWQRLSAPAAQSILSEGVSTCGRTDTSTPPFLFIPSLELADGKSFYRDTRFIRQRNLPIPHAIPETGLSEGICSPVLCPPNGFYFHAILSL